MLCENMLKPISISKNKSWGGDILRECSQMADALKSLNVLVIQPCKGLFTYYVSQKWGGPDPPSPPRQPKIRNWLTPPPSQEKIRNWLTPFPPLSEIIFCRTPMNLVKLTFQEEIFKR